MRWPRTTGLLVGLLSLRCLAKKDEPGIESTTFHSRVDGLEYFDDSDVLVFPDQLTGGVWQSNDAGSEWNEIKGVEEAVAVMKHPHDSSTAVILGSQREHWITKDQGKTWNKFKTPHAVKFSSRPISFHASDPDRILLQLENCDDFFSCSFPVHYTLDGFDTESKELIGDAIACLWAKSAKDFESGHKDIDKSRIICNVESAFSIFESESRMLISDDFFKTKGTEPLLDGDRPVSGIINVASVTRYIAAAAKSERSNEMALYVSDNSVDWQRAQFGKHRIEQDAYTILESTNYSMQIDVQSSRGAIGTLYTSNLAGNYFTKNIEHTNRNAIGYVDFEKIQDIPGIVLVNLVDNHKDVNKNRKADKEIVTKISFDDGRTWQDLMVGKKKLHLHSVTDQKNVGRIFSSPAPGIIMGVGNTGDSLKPRDKCDTYVSDDAGLTWTLADKGPHFYETGDQGGVIVMIEDEKTDEVKWSIDHGKTFTSTKLPEKINPIALTTTPDSTSLKFLILAETIKSTDKGNFMTISLDFNEVHEKKCGKDDFEDWHARVDEDGKPTCLMGHTLTFRRRKADAECFVEEEFKDPIPFQQDCPCTDADYECDFGFILNEDGDKCVADPENPPKAAKDQCTDGKKTYEGSSGYRLIPGNTCTKRNGKVKDEPVDRDCDENDVRPAPSGEINSTINSFPSKYKQFTEFYYLERCETCEGTDETVVALTNTEEVMITTDHGKHWEPIKGIKDKVIAIYPHQYFNDQVFFITEKKRVYYSRNRGATVHDFDVPEPPNARRAPILSFHPKEPDWLIWVGDRQGQTIAQISERHGDEWETMLRSVGKCDFVYREGRPGPSKLIYCEQHDGEDKDAPMSLISSDDWFKENKTELQKDVINFATMSEFIVVARHAEEENSLRADASVDGEHFANVQFPHNFQVDTQTAYTVLDSSTHAIFLHVTVSNVEGAEFGAIIKSNSNGTEYTLTIDNVNRNKAGYVDFEKVQGLEGVSLVNVVTNPGDAGNGQAKKLRTMISHNDGAEWAPIARPEDSGDFKVDWCSGSTQDCSLHLHGYTERTDPRNTLSSPTAIGVMLANGNVGEYLTSIDQADTFMSTDGGITWSMIAEGKWLWEFGDRGSIIVIVQQDTKTKEVLYTLNEGKTWEKYQFSDEDMIVQDISSVPSDTSRNFLLWGGIDKELTTVNIDFSGMKERSEKCKLDEKNPDSDADDYYLWSPKHPLSEDDCLFGHIAKYHRKIAEKECYNGRRLPVLHDIVENCKCTRQDFECAFNFERGPDGQCTLVSGLSAANPKDVCKQENVTEYSDITGYRRIPITTCQGGREFDLSPQTHPCDGFEDDWNDKHRISGAGLFFAIVIPILAACGAGWWVWRNWDGKFGRIQLGDGPTGSRIGLGGAFERDAPWIKYPVLAVSAIVAVVAAVPMVVATVYRTVRTRFGRSSGRYGSYNRPYTSRGSFQRSRGNYSVVDPDEGELLGDESEDEET